MSETRDDTWSPQVDDLRQELDAALQRIAKLEAEREWRPIESAPKDGTLLELSKWAPGASVSQYLIQARWLFDGLGDGWWISPPPMSAEKRWDSAILTIIHGRLVNSGSDAPTHWRPLGPGPENNDA